MKGDQLYLKHILDAIDKVDAYIAVGREVFIASSHWQDAVIRPTRDYRGGNHKVVETVLLAPLRRALASDCRFTRCIDSRLHGS